MKINFAKYNIHENYLDSGYPKFLIHLDYLFFKPAPFRKLKKSDNKLRWADSKDYPPSYHEFTVNMGIGSFGVQIEILYKPFRYVTIEALKINSVTGEFEVGHKIVPEYL
jgi:hypothetical protein